MYSFLSMLSFLVVRPASNNHWAVVVSTWPASVWKLPHFGNGIPLHVFQPPRWRMTVPAEVNHCYRQTAYWLQGSRRSARNGLTRCLSYNLGCTWLHCSDMTSAFLVTVWPYSVRTNMEEYQCHTSRCCSAYLTTWHVAFLATSDAHGSTIPTGYILYCKTFSYLLSTTLPSEPQPELPDTSSHLMHCLSGNLGRTRLHYSDMTSAFPVTLWSTTPYSVRTNMEEY